MSPEQLEPVLELAAMMKSTPRPNSDLANALLGQLLERCIDTLPHAFRCVLMLCGVGQCSIRETAEILELEETTVKTRYFRVNALLQ